MIEQNLLLILVLLPFLGAIAAATLPVHAHNAAAWLSGLIMCAGLVIMAVLWGPVSEGNVVRSWIGWVPSIGLNLSLRVDGFAWMFVTLVLSIGILVVIYARYYLAKTDPVPRFYSFLMAFAGAMLGILISGNMMMLVVFWEMTSVFSFLLIGYWHGNPAARDGARTSLIITAGGGVCLLAATLIIGHIVGSYEIDRILVAGDQIRSSPLYVPLIILFLLGAFTKSAQFPFHFWLPGAMTAPTPVSAFLHSATMVKAGVFLLIRFSPALGGTDIWFHIVTGTGLITLVMGGAIALFRHDLKGLLAYSTISHLGLITALTGMGTSAAILAAIFHIVNHAVFKASLFMAAGIIDHETGTRDMRKLSGLIHAMPITATLAIVAASAMAGVPLLNGFISKEMFFAEATEWHNGTLLDASLPWIATLAGALSVAYSARFVMSVFLGPPATDLPRPAHEPKAWMRRPVEVLVLICLIVGVFPAQTLGTLLTVALQSVVGTRVAEFDIALWHGFNLPLQMSLAALVGGGLLYALTGKSIAEGPEGPPFLHRIRAQRIYEWILLRLSWKWPRRIYRVVGTEKLQSQLRVMVVLSLVAGVAVLWGQPWFTPASSIGNTLDPAFALLWLAGGACAVSAAWQAKYHRFASLILLSGAGMVTCLTFVWFSAPDLAVTQLLVEIVTTVLMLLGLRWLPKRRSEIAADELLPAKTRRGRDLVIALVSGAGIAAVAYAVMTRPLVPNIGDWFLRNAYYEAGGTNAVNVILVDFRAFDTFGEITVLAIVALTVFALLRRFRPAPESIEAPHAQSTEAPSLMEGMLIPSVIMRWMFPILILISADLFLRGHDLPGGGFAAGITLAIAFLLQYLASNAKWVEARLTVLPTRWMGFGLLMAGATGMGAWLFGYPFLTAHARYIDIPFIGKVPAATALLFDLGVFALVLGAVVLMLIAIAHQSLRAIRMREVEVAEKAEKKETA